MKRRITVVLSASRQSSTSTLSMMVVFVRKVEASDITAQEGAGLGAPKGQPFLIPWYRLFSS
eukprot:2816926-Prymnesium_polylepis.1